MSRSAPPPGGRKRFTNAFTSATASTRPRASRLTGTVIVMVVLAVGTALGLGMFKPHGNSSAAGHHASGAGVPLSSGARALVAATVSATPSLAPRLERAVPAGRGAPSAAWKAAPSQSPVPRLERVEPEAQRLKRAVPAGKGASSASSKAVAAKPSPKPASQPARQEVTGQLSCESGAPVVGVWVQALDGSGWASTLSADSGTETDYWMSLPKSDTSYSLHVGCGGSRATWKMAVYSPFVAGGHNSFNCMDIPGRPGYKECKPR